MMAKLGSKKFPLSLYALGGALLLVPGSMVLRAQQPPAPPALRDAQGLETGWLGVAVEEVSPQKAQELKLPGVYGVLVTDATAASPAAEAGLKNGDVITDYNGQRVEGVVEFRRLVRETPPGRTSKMTVWHDGRPQTISAEIGKNETPNPENLFQNMRRRFNPGQNMFGFGAMLPSLPLLGVTGQDLSGQLGKYFGAPDGEGILITNVESNSPAAKAGLQAGDVITKSDGARVRSMRELRDQLRGKREATKVALSVLRKGTEVSVNVEPRRAPSPSAAHSTAL
jgi:S1-C subfamily serine protease